MANLVKGTGFPKQEEGDEVVCYLPSVYAPPCRQGDYDRLQHHEYMRDIS